MTDYQRKTDSYLTLSFVVQLLSGIVLAAGGWFLAHAYTSINDELRELNRSVGNMRNDLNYISWKTGVESRPEEPPLIRKPRTTPPQPKE